MAVIVFNQITKFYQTGLKKKKVLHDLSLEIKKGEVFGFLGPNGAGKSTAIKILLNFIFPDAGEVRINGEEVVHPQVRKHLGYLPENPCFYDYLTAEELLWFGAKTSGLTIKKNATRIDQVLAKVGLFEVKKHPLRTYSKGMLQRIGLALAIIHEPEILILDEPLSGLDPIGRYEVIELILDLKKQGKTIFFSSHILTDIERVCDRIGILHQGKLIYTGKIEALKKAYPNLERAFFHFVKNGQN